jgi:hypothetical protein
MAAARAIWNTARAITAGDLAGRYLAGRAIRPLWPAALRFHPAVWCKEVGRPLPAILAAATSPAGYVVGVQRTWLAEPGRKAALLTAKKALGQVRGAAVLLGDWAETVVVAEGVETALSASQALGLPALATLGASNFRSLTLPAAVRCVIIAPDRDPAGVGERAARALAQRLIREGRDLFLAWPPGTAKDWNEWAMAEAGHVG